MFKIALINMPFAAANIPSIALTQLKSVLGSELGDRVKAEIFYINLDFAQYLGLETYGLLSNSVEANISGLGEWFFRQAAFPEQEDNAKTYLMRHFSADRKRLEILNQQIVAKCAGGAALLDELIDRYGLHQYQLVGFTSMFSQNVATFAMARRLKERATEIVTVMGGANCETPMGEVIVKNVEHMDFVFSGPALTSFPQFVRYLLDGEKDKCDTLNGVISKKKLASPEANAASKVGAELDIDVDVPLDYDDYFAALDERQYSNLECSVPFETSRGCWWGERSHCTFCGLNGLTMKYRAMQPEKALEQFERLFEKYSSRASLFQSVDNILPREYFTEVLPRLNPPENTYIFYEIKADIKEHEAELLARSKVTKLQPGIEALATSTLRLMKKGTTSFQNLKFLKFCVNYKLDPAWNLLIGFPREEEEVYEKYYGDIPMLVHLPPPSGVFPVRFDRFSPYFVQAQEYGLKLRPCDFYGMVYPFPKEDLTQMAYYFADGNYGAQYIMNTAKWVLRLNGRVREWRARWQESGRQLRPQLTFKLWNGSRVIYDSRFGETVEHRVGEDGLKVLDALSSQMKLSRLCRALDGMCESEIEGHLAALEERKLIFRDGDLLMSLVVEPPNAENLAFLDRQAAAASLRVPGLPAM